MGKDIMTCTSLPPEIHIDIFCILILAALCIQIFYIKNRIQYFGIFIRCIAISIIFSIVDIVKTAIDYSIYDKTLIDDIVYISFIVCIILVGYNFLEYFLKTINRKITSSSIGKLLYVGPLLLVAIEALKCEKIVRTIFVIIYSILLVIYLASTIEDIVMNNRNYINKLRFISFPLIPYIFAIIHFKFEFISIAMGVVLSIIINYNNALQVLINTDGLTQINNRYNLFNYIDNKIKERSKHKNNDKFYIMMLNIDKFKIINDIYGRHYGDKCLQRISCIIENCCKQMAKYPFICRYYGDEFIIVCESTDKIMEKLESNITRLVEKEYILDDYNYNFTITIGIAEYDEDIYSARDFISKANAAIYEKRKIKKIKK